MSRKDEMLGRLQPFMRKSGVYGEIFRVEAGQFDNFDDRLSDIRKQMVVDTATWGLDIFEKELGIPTDRRKTYNERRSVIKAKMRGHGSVDIALIKLVAESFDYGDINVQYGPITYTFDTYRAEEFSPPYPIIIRFVDARGIPSNIEDLKKEIEEIKPAHIRVEYLFRYMTWDELDDQEIIWDELDALGLTWDEFETGAWIN